MTVKETISQLKNMPEDMHLLIDVNGMYTELLSSDLKIVHKAKLEEQLANQVSQLVKDDYKYIGMIKAK